MRAALACIVFKSELDCRHLGRQNRVQHLRTLRRFRVASSDDRRPAGAARSATVWHQGREIFGGGGGRRHGCDVVVALSHVRGFTRLGTPGEAARRESSRLQLLWPCSPAAVTVRDGTRRMTRLFTAASRVCMHSVLQIQVPTVCTAILFLACYRTQELAQRALRRAGASGAAWPSAPHAQRVTCCASCKRSKPVHWRRS